MLSVGDGIAIAGLAIAALGVFVRMTQAKPLPLNGNHVRKDFCDERYQSLQRWITGINDALRELKADVKTLLENSHHGN